MSDGERTIEIEVLRYHPEHDKEPRYQSFKVPFAHDTSVLQGLQYIKDHLDGSLTFRWSCRMAICGSCGKMVNGEPKLSCHTFLRDYYPGKLRVEPLSHFPIVRDLAVENGRYVGMSNLEPDLGDETRFQTGFTGVVRNHRRRGLAAALKAKGATILCWTVRSAAAEAEARRVAHNITFEGYAAALPGS